MYPLVAADLKGIESLGRQLHSIAYELVSISNEEADKIDALFRGSVMDLIVDRDRLSDSCDQWIYMTLVRADKAIFQEFDFPLNCILTW